MKALLEKELFGLVPYLASGLLMLFIATFGLLFDFNWGMGTLWNLQLFHLSWFLSLGTLCFLVGQYILRSEFQDGTIHFLDALPLSRRQVFLAKFLTGLGLTCFFSLAHTGLLLLTSFISTGKPSTLLVSGYAVSNLILFALFYALGALLTWLGGLGVGVLYALVSILTAVFLANARMRALLGPFVHLEPGFAPSPSLQAVGVVLTLGLSVLSAVLFVRAGSKAAPRPKAKKRRTKRPELTGALALVGWTVLLGNAHQLFNHTKAGLQKKSYVVHSSPPAVYRAPDRAAATKLLEALPDIDARVGRLFPGVTRPAVHLELLAAGKFHAGYFTGSKIRVALDAHAEETLAHELAHAYAFALSGRLGDAMHRHALFFLEGLAVWAAAEALGSRDGPDRMHAWAAAIARQERGHFDELFDFAQRAARYDPYELYPLGTLFVEALVQSHGAAPLPCILRRLRAQARAAVEGRTLWNSIAARCGLDLPRIETAYRLLRTQAVDQHDDPYFDDRRPTLFAQPVIAAGRDTPRLEVTGNYARPPPLVCRFRPFESDGLGELEEYAVIGGDCRVSAAATGQRMFYQVGYRLPQGYSVFQPWRALAFDAPRCRDLSCLDARAETPPAPSAPKRPFPVQMLPPRDVKIARFSPDGVHLATATGDGDVRLWDAQAQALLAVLPGRTAVRDLAFSPSGGRLLVVVGGIESLRVYDVATQRLLAACGSGYPDAGAFLDEDRLAVVGTEFVHPPGGGESVRFGVFEVRDAQTLNQLSTTRMGSSADWKTLAKTAEVPARLLAVSEDSAHWVEYQAGAGWRVRTPSRALIPMLDRAQQIALAPDGRALALADDALIRLVDSDTGAVLARRLQKGWRMKQLAFDPLDASRVIVGQWDQIDRWDTKTNPLHMPSLTFEDFDLWTVSPTGMVWTFDEDNILAFRDPLTTEEAIAAARGRGLQGLRAKAKRIWGAAGATTDFWIEVEGPAPPGSGLERWAIDGTRIGMVDAPPSGGTWHLAPNADWGVHRSSASHVTRTAVDLNRGQRLVTLMEDRPGAEDPSLACALRPNARPRELYCLERNGENAGTLQIWSPDTGTTRSVRLSDVHQRDEVFFSPDGTRLALQYYKSLRVWNVRDFGSARKTPLAPVAQTDMASGKIAVFSPDASFMALATYDPDIMRWDLVSAPTKVAALTGQVPFAAISALAFSADGTELHVGTEQGEILDLSLDGAVRRRRFPHARAIRQVVARPGGHLIALAEDRSIAILPAEGAPFRVTPMYQTALTDDFAAVWTRHRGRQQLDPERSRLPSPARRTAADVPAPGTSAALRTSDH